MEGALGVLVGSDDDSGEDYLDTGIESYVDPDANMDFYGNRLDGFEWDDINEHRAYRVRPENRTGVRGFFSTVSREDHLQNMQ